MGKRGPKAQPIELKIAAGTASESDALAVEYGLPPNPFDAKLSPSEHQAWMAVVRALVDTGTHVAMTPADFGAIERAALALCRARQWSIEATRVIESGNRYIETRANGQMPHTALREERIAWDTVAKSFAELGMSPTSRGSLSLVKGGGPTPGGDDPLMGRLLSMGPQPVED